MAEQYLTVILTLGPVVVVTIGSILVAFLSGRKEDREHEEEKEKIKKDAELAASKQLDDARLKREERLQAALEKRNLELDKRLKEQEDMILESHKEAIELREEVFALRVVATHLVLALRSCLGDQGIPQELKDALNAAGIKGY